MISPQKGKGFEVFIVHVKITHVAFCTAFLRRVAGIGFVIHIQIYDFFILLLRGLEGIVNVRLRFVLQEVQPRHVEARAGRDPSCHLVWLRLGEGKQHGQNHKAGRSVNWDYTSGCSLPVH